jgi:hypothetical protein
MQQPAAMLKGQRMSGHDTEATMRAYLDAVFNERDFSRYYAADVSLQMMDTAVTVQGIRSVREYLTVLRGRIQSESSPLGLTVANGKAYMEGHGVNRTEDLPGLDYCVVYEVEDGLITSMRTYGSLAALMLV